MEENACQKCNYRLVADNKWIILARYSVGPLNKYTILLPFNSQVLQNLRKLVLWEFSGTKLRTKIVIQKIL